VLSGYVRVTPCHVITVRVLQAASVAQCWTYVHCNEISVHAQSLEGPTSR
jgi:hypothetical protein